MPRPLQVSVGLMHLLSQHAMDGHARVVRSGHNSQRCERFLKSAIDVLGIAAGIHDEYGPRSRPAHDY